MVQRILFVIEPGMGHFHPLVPIIRTLQARGHAVALATSQLYQGRAEKEGIPFYALSPHYAEERLAEFYPWWGRLRSEYLRVSYDFVKVFMDAIPHRMSELARIVDVFQPTVVVAGATAFAAQLFCERVAPLLPWAVVCPMTHFMSPNILAPPAGYPRPTGGRFLQRLYCRGVVSGAHLLLAPWRWTLNRNRRRVGLLSHANPMSPNVMAPYLLLHLCSVRL